VIQDDQGRDALAPRPQRFHRRRALPLRASSDRSAARCRRPGSAACTPRPDR
jgi:hypothetical protein